MAPNRFLVHQHATPDTLLYRRLAEAGEIVAADGREDPKGFHLAVVDCASIKTDEMSGLLPQLSAALDGNVPVVLLQPEEEHKKSLASKVHGWSSNSSLACFIYPIRDPHGKRLYAVHEQFAPRRPDVPLQVIELHREPDGKLVAAEPVEIAASTAGPAPAVEPEHVAQFVGDVTNVLEQLRQKGVVDLVGIPPADCPYWASPYKIYQPLTVGGYNGSPTATQVVSGTAEVGIYYDNLTYSNPVQWTLVGNQGNYSAGIVQNNGSGIGWSIGGFEIQGPGLGSSTAGNFSLYQSSPQSVSGQTNYTSSVSFTVGVEAGTDGLGANASYTESNDVNYSLNDWEITLSGDDSWNFYQQTPYSGETVGSFPSGAQSGGGPAGLPSISTSALSFATQTVWLVLNPLQSTMPINFTYQCYPTCIIFSSTGKNWSASYYSYSNLTFTNTYNLDFGPANPST